MAYRFEWDRRKAVSNVGKHGMTFEEASTVFSDSSAFIFDDEDHSTDERREIIIGHSCSGRLVIVCFTERAEGVIGLISARSSTKHEREKYEKNIGT
jgi:uncharacterized DUF497 family protein